MITSGQQFALVGIERDDVERVWHDLGMDIGKASELCLHYVQACPGTEVCTFGVQDSLGRRYEESAEGNAGLRRGKQMSAPRTTDNANSRA